MLFDEDFSFIPFNMYVKNSDSNLYSNKEGFLRGNMFKDEYLPYKDYNYCNLIPCNNKEELLYELMSLSFAINDLNLYLDIHPLDKDLLHNFNTLVEKYNMKEKCYVEHYGPLVLNDSTSTTKFDWIKSPWPWMDKGDMYV